jgi:hypothetical protein
MAFKWIGALVEPPLPALAVGRRDRCRTGQLHAQRLGQRVHGRRRAHGVAVADRGRRRGDQVGEFFVVDFAGGPQLARLPLDGARAGALALEPAVQHRPDRQRDGRQIERRRRHQASRRGLVAADGQHHPVEGVTVQHLDQAEIGEVAVERRGRPLAGLLDRVDGKLEANAAGGNDAVAHALGQLDMVAVARRQIGAGLGDADDRFARLQFLAGDAVVEVALDIGRRHLAVAGIVEPHLRAQLRLVLFGHNSISSPGAIYGYCRINDGQPR